MPVQKIEAVEPEEVDILADSGLIGGIETEYDLTEDFYARTCPPPGRVELNKPRYYSVKVFLDSDDWTKNTRQGFRANDPNGTYYAANLTLKIQINNPALQDYQDYVAGFKVSTAVPKGKRMSSAMMVLRDLGVNVTKPLNDLQVAQNLTKILAKLGEQDKNLMIADADWQAWDKTKVDKRNQFGQVAICNKKLLSSMVNFPKKADGSYEHICYTAEGLEVSATLKVSKLLPFKKKADEVKKAEPVKETPKATAKPKKEPEPEPEVSEVELDGDGEVVLEV